ncbi:MAG: hypothetical protein O7H41_18250 [Planctomycetota bacterium]|nr:hypothetical protein [Planctomycetota bacterium]
MISRRLLLLVAMLIVSGWCLYLSLPSQQAEKPSVTVSDGAVSDGLRKALAEYYESVQFRLDLDSADEANSYDSDWPDGIFDLVPPSYWLAPDGPDSWEGSSESVPALPR